MTFRILELKSHNVYYRTTVIAIDNASASIPKTI